MTIFDTIETRLRNAFPSGTVTLTSADHVHFKVVVCDPGFEGLTTLQQHRKVYAAMGDLMDGACHALEIQTKT